MLKQVISFGCWLLLLILAGCGEASPYAEEPSAQDRTITLNLDITTKAAAEPGESPDNFHLWIFNGDKLLKYITENKGWETSDVAGIDLKTTIETEIDATGISAVQFYLLLNTEVIGPWAMTPAKLKALTFTLPSQPYSHDNKVPMSGEAELTGITIGQTNYEVEIDAGRSVGKLEIYCTKNLQSTSLFLNKITLGHEPDKGYLVETPANSDIIYDEERILFEPQNGQEIATVLSGDLPIGNQLEKVIENFTPIVFPSSSSPYLLENQNGGKLQVEGVDETITDEGTRYCLTLNYTLDGSSVEKKIYLTEIERNTLNKVFIRIKEKVFDIEVSYSVKDWVMEVLTPEF
ncbi:hypothetical protein [Mediterranea massiliensis]|uniref:hypothetical protein n=1 Tax=Mediterranea massiliensis TaxID=1841865 RepID=UPI0023F1BC89|nr:hypothetical protein [Mediterranea massiliensis]